MNGSPVTPLRASENPRPSLRKPQAQPESSIAKRAYGLPVFLPSFCKAAWLWETQSMCSDYLPAGGGEQG